MRLSHLGYEAQGRRGTQHLASEPGSPSGVICTQCLVPQKYLLTLQALGQETNSFYSFYSALSLKGEGQPSHQSLRR